MDNSTRDWVQQVVELTKRLLELDAERDRVMEQLALLRAGEKPTLGIAAGAMRPPRREKVGFTPPTSGVSKMVYDHILANPGVAFTTDHMTKNLGLDESRRPAVTTALSRLAQAKVIERSGFGTYVFPSPSQDPSSESSNTPGGPEQQID